MGPRKHRYFLRLLERQDRSGLGPAWRGPGKPCITYYRQKVFVNGEGMNNQRRKMRAGHTSVRRYHDHDPGINKEDAIRRQA